LNMPKTMPAIFFGHGNPMNALLHNEWTEGWAAVGKEGILIVGSGNLVHNLHTYAWGKHMPEPYDWAVRFETAAKEMMVKGEFEPLVNYESLGRDALLSIPTPDHYLPLLYVIGTKRKDDTIAFPWKASTVAPSQC